MDIVEYVDKVYGVKLNAAQITILKIIEKAHDEGRELHICYPPRTGRKIIKEICEKYFRNEELK